MTEFKNLSIMMGAVTETVSLSKTVETILEFCDAEALKEKLYVILKDALRIISLTYMPSRIMLYNFIANPVYSYNYEDIKLQAEIANK